MDEQPKTLVIYHANCIDGFTAAWAAMRHFGNTAEYVPAQYAGEGRDVELPDARGRAVVFVDFCPPRTQLVRLLDEAAGVWVYDHHKTAAEACGDLQCCVFDMERSGAGIAWDHFVGGPRPWFIPYVEDRDLWRWKLPRSKEVSAYLAAQPMTFARWNSLCDEDALGAASKGAGILDYIEMQASNAVQQATRMRFLGHDDIPIRNATMLISEIVGRLAESAPFAVGWFQEQGGKFVYSLRSRGDFDVSVLAKRMGGGGHKGAAGFACDKLPHELAEPARD